MCSSSEESWGKRLMEVGEGPGLEPKGHCRGHISGFYSKTNSKPLKESNHRCDVIWFLCQENHSQIHGENELEGTRTKTEKQLWSCRVLSWPVFRQQENMEKAKRTEIFQLHWTGVTEKLDGGGNSMWKRKRIKICPFLCPQPLACCPAHSKCLTKHLEWLWLFPVKTRSPKLMVR